MLPRTPLVGWEGTPLPIPKPLASSILLPLVLGPLDRVYTKTRPAGRLRRGRPAANSFAYAKMRPAMFYPKMRPAENAAFYPEFPMNLFYLTVVNFVNNLTHNNYGIIIG